MFGQFDSAHICKNSANFYMDRERTDTHVLNVQRNPREDAATLCRYRKQTVNKLVLHNGCIIVSHICNIGGS